MSPHTIARDWGYDWGVSLGANAPEGSAGNGAFGHSDKERKARRDGEKGWASSTASRSEYLLSLLNGSIGRLAIAEIEPADVLTAVRRIESKGNLESARRTLQLAGSVFRYAVATARLRSDPTRDLRGALSAGCMSGPSSCCVAWQALLRFTV